MKAGCAWGTAPCGTNWPTGNDCLRIGQAALPLALKRLAPLAHPLQEVPVGLAARVQRAVSSIAQQLHPFAGELRELRREGPLGKALPHIVHGLL